MSRKYKRIHIIINPASGKDEPILNTLNHVFNQYDIDWTVSVTRKYGNATEMAREAVASGVDLVAGYGGDGTQHEVANGVLGSGVAMGVLPGGTGNGFANEVGIPRQLKPAVELLCTSQNVRHFDVAQVGDQYFIQRLYTGIEPEQQTSRELKDKYGVLAYAVSGVNQLRAVQNVPYRLTIDGEVIEEAGVKCYVVNSAKMGTGLSIDVDFSAEDGLLDVFIVGKDFQTIASTVDRFLKAPTKRADLHHWQGKEILIEADSSQPVWTDGEFLGRTPVTIRVVPGALAVVAP